MQESYVNSAGASKVCLYNTMGPVYDIITSLMSTIRSSGVTWQLFPLLLPVQHATPSAAGFPDASPMIGSVVRGSGGGNFILEGRSPESLGSII